jgi:Sporulation initiation factor Spo0A C terminal.
VKKVIISYLLDIGIKPHYKGFDYLVSALVLTTSAKSRMPIGEIYKIIAVEHDVTKDRVERCLRTVVTIYFETMDNPPKYKFTNAEFIFLCTEQIKLRTDTFPSSLGLT